MTRLMLVGLCAVVTGCAPAMPAPQISQQGREAAGVITDMALDAFVTSGRLPAASNSITFSDADQFDYALYSSLRSYADTPSIRVRVGMPTNTRDLPPRAATWVAAVDRGPGAVLNCDVTETQIGLATLFAIGKAVWDFLAPRAQQYALYRPAANYHVVVETRADSRTISALRFINASVDEATVRQAYRVCAP